MANSGTVLAVMLASLLALAPVSGPAEARSHFAQMHRVQADAVRLSRDEAAAIAQRRTGGRVLSVNLQRNGRPVYRVKLLIEGERVRTVAVDAQTGQLRD